MAHSRIVGGSTAKRVIACPGSVALVQKAPPQPSSKYADEGTMLHGIMALILEHNEPAPSFLGAESNGQKMTLELLEEKVLPALAALDVIDPEQQMEYAVEQTVSFGDFLPDVFGSADLIGRLGDRAIILDWKFGSGVTVEAEDNPQGMFYTAAAMRTPGLEWVFDGAKDIEIIIVQPPSIRRWVTSFDRIRQFERELAFAVRRALQPDAPLATGEHCRFCPARPLCPEMTGAADRALQKAVKDIDASQLGALLSRADLLEGWISDLRGLAMQVLESGNPVPGFKLVAKRATREWTDEDAAATALVGLGVDPYEQSVLPVAQAEKKLKALKKPLPTELVTAVSSGNTMAPESDPRPAVLQIGQQLTAALSKIV